MNADLFRHPAAASVAADPTADLAAAPATEPRPPDCDVLIVGAGPAGLCFARALADSGLRVTVLERQSRAALQAPADDGREIALTHASRAELSALDIWNRLPAAAIAPMHGADVLDGSSLQALGLRGENRRNALGWLVANHEIRRAAYASLAHCGNIELRCDTRVQSAYGNAQDAGVRLADGQTLRARLLVAADSRYSETRRQLGIPASMVDFGKTMLVCRMRHSTPHRHIAREWFDYAQTLAVLPLNAVDERDCSSIVITLPPALCAELAALPPARFNREIERRFQGRYGSMELCSERYTYPLVGVYAQRFVGAHCALIGDAAVGMHPVTAHGFNFGLRSQACLAHEILAARRRGADIGSSAVLAAYEQAHRRATRPLYLATNAIARLYTDDRLPARIVRRAALRIAAHLPPFKQALLARLTESSALR